MSVSFRAIFKIAWKMIFLLKYSHYTTRVYSYASDSVSVASYHAYTNSAGMVKWLIAKRTLSGSHTESSIPDLLTLPSHPAVFLLCLDFPFYILHLLAWVLHSLLSTAIISVINDTLKYVIVN